MKKTLKTLVSMLLTIAILAQSLPLALAADFISGGTPAFDGGPASGLSGLEPPEEDVSYSYPVAEIEEKRDETSKVFRMSDGSYTVAVYPEPVHYKDGDAYSEIDNTLERISEDGRTVFRTRSSLAGFSLPEALAGERVEISDGKGAALSFSMVGASGGQLDVCEKRSDQARMEALREFIAAKEAGIADPSAAGILTGAEAAYSLSEAARALTDLCMRIEKNVSEVTYRGVLKNVDLSYRISGTRLKESLILSAVPEQSSFDFIVNAEGMSARLLDDGSVLFEDGDGVGRFRIGAPFMNDGAGESTGEVRVGLSRNADGSYVYSLTPDRDWLEDGARVYPVTIDPPVEVVRIEKIKDTTAIISGPVGNLGDSDSKYYLKAGNYYSTTAVQAMIYAQLPSELTSTDGIRLIDAKLFLYGKHDGTAHCPNGVRLNAYRISADWNTGDVYENGVFTITDTFGATDRGDILDYVCLNDSVASGYVDWYEINITKAAQKWLDGTCPNYGVALAAVSEDLNGVNYAKFYDSSNTNVPEACPAFLYQYRDSKGIEDYWTFTSVPAGRNGTAGVNNFNGNLVVVEDLFASTGVRMPLNLSINYSFNSVAGTKSGLGLWRTNYHLSVEVCDITYSGSNYKYCLNDSDGTKHYLFEDSQNQGTFIDEDGIGIKLKKLVGNSDFLYEIFTKDGAKLNFDHFGRFRRITDTNGNYIQTNYVTYSDPNDHRFASIVESGSAGGARTTTVAYSGNTVVITPTGQGAVQLIFNNSNREKLTEIRYPDYGSGAAASVGFTYSSNKITEIANGLSRRTGVQYDGKNRVYTLSYGSSSAALETYTFSYGWNSTAVTSSNYGEVTYQFNNFGQTVGVVDKTSSMGQNYEFGASGALKTGKENKLLTVSRSLAASENLVGGGHLDTSAAVNAFSVYPDANGVTKSICYSGHNSSASLIVNKPTSCSDEKLVYVSVSFPKPGTYTLSAYIMTDAVLSGIGARIQANVFTANGYRDTYASNYFIQTNGDWMRAQVTFTAGSADTHCHVGLYLPADTHGQVLLDDVQLQRAEAPGSFNYLNSSALTSLSGWSYTATAASSAAQSGDPSGMIGKVTLSGDPLNQRYITQLVYASGAKDDVIVFGGWAKADASLPLNAVTGSVNGAAAVKPHAPEFRIKVAFYDSSDNRLGPNAVAEFNPGVTGWQYVTAKAVAPAAYSYFRYTLSYDFNVGSVSFGSPFLYKEGYGVSYTYDRNGNLVSSSDAANSSASFAFTDDELSRTLSPAGESYTYNYDAATRNMEYALSSSGQRVDVGYNATGGASSMSISSVDIEEPVADTEFYIINAKTGRALTRDGSTAELRPWTLGNTYQKWRLYYPGTNFYTIRNASNYDYALQVTGDTNVVTGNLGWGTNPLAYRYRFSESSGGAYRITTGHSSYEKVLREGDGEASSDNRPIWANLSVSQAEDDFDTASEWYFIKTTLPTSETLSSSSTYTSEGRYVTGSTDALGHTTLYRYNSAGLIRELQDAKGYITYYLYDTILRTTSVSLGGTSVSYGYSGADDTLTEINVDGTLEYRISYDGFGRKTLVKVSNADDSSQNLASYGYNDKNQRSRLTYADGQSVYYEYDEAGRLSEKSLSDAAGKKQKYVYDPNGALNRVEDTVWGSGVQTVYDYDLAGRTVGVRAGALSGAKNTDASMQIRYTAGKGTVDQQTVSVYDGSNQITESTRYNYVYGDAYAGQIPGAIYTVKKDGNDLLSYGYDALGRVTQRSLGYLTESWSYTPGSTQISSHTPLTGSSYTSYAVNYSYDANGNIVSKSGGENATYAYDSLNRLVRSNDADENKTRVYAYDDRGNILSETVYAYTTGSLTGVSPLETKSYAYGRSAWPDVLTSYDGHSISSDILGNPSYYWNGLRFTWKHGKSLGEVFSGATRIAEYFYNGDGLRTKKTLGGVDYVNYHILDGIYVGDTRVVDGDTYHTLYIYDDAGSVIGLQSNGTRYWFVKNLQGDVTTILNNSGWVMARYSYDAWGNITSIKNSFGVEVTEAYHIALRNPFRYRSYMYDDETGLYYLRSRYYDPVTKRFLNADAFLSTGQGLTGFNMFAYCGNNPILYVDPTGRSLVSVFGFGTGLVGTSSGFTASSPAESSAYDNVQYNAEQEKINSQEPPPPESGYVPPKKLRDLKRVRNPNGKGKGWPSDDGGVWIPNNGQHAGPGWTVQYPGGRHEHRYPSGHARSHKIDSTTNKSFTDYIFGGAIIVGAGIGILFIAADDVTGIGTIDDVAIPVLFDVFSKGVQMFA